MDRQLTADRARRILLEVWRPIPYDVPASEYDAYLPELLALLEEGVEADVIAARLDAILIERMGLRPLARSRAAAEALIALR